MSDILIVVSIVTATNIVWMIFTILLLNSRRGSADRPIKLNLPKIPVPERFKRADPDPEKHEFSDLSSDAPSIEEAMKSLRT